MAGCGLIGVGHHGRRYLDAFLSPTPPGRLVAVARQDVTKECLPVGVRQFADYSDLIGDPGVSVVIAVVPPALHRGVCEAAFKAKKPLLLEKPLAQRAVTAREIAAKARESGARLMVAHTLRFDPVVMALKENVHRVGDVASVTVSQRFKKSRASWWDEPGSLGTTVFVGVHGFDLIPWLCGARILKVLCAQSRILTRNVR